jgi:hypothetical protein
MQKIVEISNLQEMTVIMLIDSTDVDESLE